MSVLHINQNNFDQVKNSEKTVLLDFYADWCGPCRMVAPLVEEIAAEHPEYLICKVNVDDEPALAQEFGVQSIPTLVVLKDGKIVTNGGRVLGVTATGKDLKTARANAYEATKWIKFENKYMRNDIGKAIDEV